MLQHKTNYIQYVISNANMLIEKTCKVTSYKHYINKHNRTVCLRPKYAVFLHFYAEAGLNGINGCKDKLCPNCCAVVAVKKSVAVAKAGRGAAEVITSVQHGRGPWTQQSVPARLEAVESRGNATGNHKAKTCVQGFKRPMGT